MRLDIQRAEERGSASHGWLESRFSFSFADYLNPDRMGFGVLRVINDDRIMPGGIFNMHPHRDMEIVTIVTKGALEHNDSMGHRGVLKAGEVQHMSAGSGIRHAEANAGEEVLELFQIWIYPKSPGIPPVYRQKGFDPDYTHNRLGLLVSPDGAEASLPMHQDARIYRGVYDTDSTQTYQATARDHGIYLFVVEGEVTVSGTPLNKRDAAGIETPGQLTLDLKAGSDILLFDLPMIKE